MGLRKQACLRSPACENPTAAWSQGYLTRPIFLRAVRRELRLTDRVISDALVARAFAALTLARSSGGDDVLLETDLAAFLAAESSAEAKRSDTPRCVPSAEPSEQADGGADGSDPPLAVADGITTPVWARIGPSPTLAQARLPRGLRRRHSPSAFAVPFGERRETVERCAAARRAAAAVARGRVGRRGGRRARVPDLPVSRRPGPRDGEPLPSRAACAAAALRLHCSSARPGPT